MPDEVISESLIKLQENVIEVPASTPEPMVPALEISVSPSLNVRLTRRKSNTSGDLLVTANKDSKVIVNGIEL